MGEHILVIGATFLDAKGRPESGLEPATSNPGFVRLSRGGTARNVAENLARLGAEVILMSAVGDDETGQWLRASTADAGVDVTYVSVRAGESTGTYIAFMEDDGTLAVALNDAHLAEQLSGQYIYQHRRLIRDARLVFIDGSLSTGAIQTVVNLTQKYDIPLCADPSSTRLVNKFRPFVQDFTLMVPSEAEASALCNTDITDPDPDESLEIARRLVRLGLRNVAITLADFDIVYATSDENGYLPTKFSEIVDSTGTGDAVTAAIIFGMMNDLPIIECMRLGAAAGGLTLQNADTVVPDLSLDMLYDHLS